MKIYLYVGLVLAVLGFSYWWSSSQYKAGYTAASLTYETLLRDQKIKSDQLLKKKQAIVDDVTAKSLAEQGKEKIIYKTITKQVVKYVENNSQCDLTRGAVRLLNDAAQPERVPTDKHPTITEAEAEQTSTITQSAQIQHCIGWAEQYNEIARRYSNLIDVVTVSQ